MFPGVFQLLTPCPSALDGSRSSVSGTLPHGGLPAPCPLPSTPLPARLRSLEAVGLCCASRPRTSELGVGELSFHVSLLQTGPLLAAPRGSNSGDGLMPGSARARPLPSPWWRSVNIYLKGAWNSVCLCIPGLGSGSGFLGYDTKIMSN